MQTFLSSLTALGALLLKMSLQVSVVIALVLLVQWLWRKNLSPRVRYALWLLVVVRLVLPTSLESSISVFQHVRTATTTIARAAKPDPSAVQSPATVAPSAPVSAKVDGDLRAPSLRVDPKNAPGGRVPPQTAAIPARNANVALWPWPLILSLIWLAGVGFLLGRIIWIPFRLNTRLARQETASSPAVFEILEQAKRLIGVNQVLPIVQSRAVESPALLGFIRPWLLLPHGLVEKFTPDELRLVFLHELAHLKRRDIAVNWLTTLLQILHWFNPLVWYAFARMRADREEACDELALSFARAEENRAYGHAIIKLLEGFSRPPALPGLVGILEDKQQMNRRITMIAQFKKMIPWSAPALGLLLVLGIVTLTDAQTEKTPAAASEVFATGGPSARIIVSGSNTDAAGQLSPDQSAIAYPEFGPNGSDIIVRELKTGTKINLTAKARGSSYETPLDGCWSPDSSALACAWMSEGNRRSARILSRTGAAPRIIFERPDEYFWPHDWSEDGRRLVGSLMRKERSAAIAVVEVATGASKVIEEAGRADHVRFSPDGRWVVFDRFNDGNRDVFLLSVESGERVRITDSPAEDGSAIFSRDGKRLLFSSNRRGHWDLWSVPIENGRVNGAPALVKYDFGDYPKRAMQSGAVMFKIHALHSGVFEVNVASESSTPTQLVTSTTGSHATPAWSLDGTKLAYVRLDKTPRLAVLTVASGHEETFDPGMSAIHFMFWSPDGETLALRGNPKRGPAGVFVYSLAARTAVTAPLAVDGRVYAQGKTYPLGFSDDGTEMLFLLAEQKQRVAYNLKTGRERDVSTAADRAWLGKPNSEKGPLFQYSPSRDGAKSAYIEMGGGEQRLVVVDAAGQNKRVVARAKAPADLGAPRWSPDGTKLAYYLWPTEDAPRKHLRVCAADGAWDREVRTTGMYIPGPAFPPVWSNDSARLAITLSSDIPNQIGVLENIFAPEKLVAK